MDELEKGLLAEVKVDDAWDIVERFNMIVRESGSQGERDAVSLLAEKLGSYGIDYEIYTPTLFVSLPRSASLKVLGAAGRTLYAKTPSMSKSTAPGFLTAELVYLGTGQAKRPSDVWAGLDAGAIGDVAGKAVLIEGLPLPGRVTDLMAAGAAAVVFISPGERIHEGTCTSIWGSPDPDTISRKPKIPVVSVKRSDGLWLIEELKKGRVEVQISTELEEGWKPLSVLVAEIKGTVEPEKFVLLHGHLDSWHVGVSDNGTGDAALLELARVFKKFQKHLKRTVRVAWWSGHSHGRYACSTWYADMFALDLLENCIAHVNCDSPGTRDADSFEGIYIMKEFEAFCKAAIKDAAGAEATAARVARAGDYSFSNLGVGGFYMGLSTIPESVRQAKELYHVGGSGGNNEWHHEDDTIEVADRERLLRDIRVYALSVFRCANSPVLPYNFGDAAGEILETVRTYAAMAQEGGFDLSHVVSEAAAFHEVCRKLTERQAALRRREMNDPEVKVLNRTLMEVDRLVVRLNYVRGGVFEHDPALESKPVPDLALAERLPSLEKGSDDYYRTIVRLRRGANKVVWALRKARAVAGGVL